MGLVIAGSGQPSAFLDGENGDAGDVVTPRPDTAVHDHNAEHKDTNNINSGSSNWITSAYIGLDMELTHVGGQS